MPSKKVCTKTLLPDLCGEFTLKSIVVMVVYELNVLLEYFPYNYIVQRTTLKPVLWILFLICLLFFFTVTIVSVLLYPPSVAISLALCFCIFSSSSPASSTFSSSVAFAQCFFSLSFQTVESLHKMKFTFSVANNFCFLK